MRISYDIRGLQDMIKAMEEVASDREIAKANKRVVERTQTHVKESMRKHIPVSADNSKSGRALKYGRESRPTHGHAKDNIPVEPVKMYRTRASGEVGWQLSDNSEYFYMKFVEWGTYKMPPRPFIEQAANAARAPLTKIAREEFGQLVDSKLNKFK